MRAVLRFVASVMMVSGALLITDAAVTLLWQEPVSAVVAHREQTRLKEALIDPPPRVIRRMPLNGDAIGRIEIPAIGVKDYVVEGTDLENLRKGPGHYPETPLPGDRGTVAIAGHRTTYGAPFRSIDELDRGQEIAVDMPYGRYVYRVERTEDRGAHGPVGARPRAPRPARAERLPPALQRRGADRRLLQAHAPGAAPGSGSARDRRGGLRVLDVGGVLRLEPEDQATTRASEIATTASQYRSLRIISGAEPAPRA